MKKHFLILTTLMLTLTTGHGQTNVYHPFPDSNAVWIGSNWYIDNNNWVIIDDYNIFISGDTIIGQYQYHKLYKYGHRWSSNWPPQFWYYYSGQYCEFRQDSANKKIYLYTNGADTLAYDFNLNAGDTLPETFVNTNWADYNYIQSVDSILIGNQYRKRFWISAGSNANYTALIEGIGSTFGVFSNIVPPFESEDMLYCVKINNQTVWNYDSTSQCELMTIIEELNLQNQIAIYPNPFSFATFVKLNKYLKDATLTIYNTLGQVKKEIYSISGQEIKLYRDNLPSGVYFIRLTQDNKIITTAKLIIND